MDTPLSETTITNRLAEIQKRCNELRESSVEDLELSLAESNVKIDDDPYNSQR